MWKDTFKGHGEVTAPILNPLKSLTASKYMTRDVKFYSQKF